MAPKFGEGDVLRYHGRVSEDEETSPYVLCLECRTARLNGTICSRCGEDVPSVSIRRWWGLPLDQLNRKLLADFTGIRGVQSDRWIMDYCEKAHGLRDGTLTSRDSVDMYWVRLHGLMTEMHDGLRDMMDREPSSPSWGHRSPKLWRCFQSQVSVLAAIRAHVTALSREQHIYADDRRHCVCHVHQRVHFPKVVNKGTELRETHWCTVLGEQVAWDERRRAVLRIFCDHGSDHLRVAQSFAETLAPAVEQLSAAWEEHEAAHEALG